MDITTTQQFDQIINDSDKKAVLIDFWAPWCGPCRMLTPTISKLSQTYPNNVYKVNVDVQRQVAARYGIRGIPSVKIFKKGEVMETLQGVQPENVYSEKLKYYMN
ncbi:thioredoxin [bacterium]|jgi:thioredoxin|nr:thioredoxin [bacterium]|tara:strand:- start:1408 stop:1722 length:315 start_codon:yes stop_codon:yes gene_type:complete